MGSNMMNGCAMGYALCRADKRSLEQSATIGAAGSA